MTALQISMLLNIGSLIFGLSAWILAFLAIKSRQNTAFSFCCCAVSLLCQLFEIRNRVSIGDYAAIEDTIRAVLIASVVLIGVTAVLNIVVHVKAKN